MRIRIPCRKCLVQPTCTKHCKDFGEFATTLTRIENKLSNFFEAIDNRLEKGGTASVILDIVGKIFLGPFISWILSCIVGEPLYDKASKRFHKRYDGWYYEYDE